MSRRIHVTVVAPPGVRVEIDEEDRLSESRTASLDPGTIVVPPTPDDPIVLRLYELKEAATSDTRPGPDSQPVAAVASSKSPFRLQLW